MMPLMVLVINIMTEIYRIFEIQCIDYKRQHAVSACCKIDNFK